MFFFTFPFEQKGWDSCSHPLSHSFYSHFYPHVIHGHIRTFFDFAMGLFCGTGVYYWFTIFVPALQLPLHDWFAETCRLAEYIQPYIFSKLLISFAKVEGLQDT